MRLALPVIAALLVSCSSSAPISERVEQTRAALEGDPCVPSANLPACVAFCDPVYNPDGNPTCEQQNADALANGDPAIGLACLPCCYQVDPNNPLTYSIETYGCQ